MYSTKPESRGYHASLSYYEMGRPISDIWVEKLERLLCENLRGWEGAEGAAGAGGRGFKVGSLEGSVGNRCIPFDFLTFVYTWVYVPFNTSTHCSIGALQHNPIHVEKLRIISAPIFHRQQPNGDLTLAISSHKDLLVHFGANRDAELIGVWNYVQCFARAFHLIGIQPIILNTMACGPSLPKIPLT